MTIIAILQYPDPRLRTKAKTVTDFADKKLQKTIDDMFTTLYRTENCAGLAATQLDIADPYRITVIDVSMEKNQPLCLVNPEIVSTEGEITQWEGCMSVYPDDVHGKVTRPSKVKARAHDRHGKLIEIEAEGLLAKCIQHEIDHLNGGLYIDHLSALKRHLVDNKINKLRKRSADE
jgi:peptide deformylase